MILFTIVIYLTMKFVFNLMTTDVKVLTMTAKNNRGQSFYTFRNADSNMFNDIFFRWEQQVINNHIYRKRINRWKKLKTGTRLIAAAKYYAQKNISHRLCWVCVLLVCIKYLLWPHILKFY